MCFTYDGVADVYRETTPRARKARRCSECKHKILPGEGYLYMWQVAYGAPFKASVCRDCQYLRCLIAGIEIGAGCGAYEAWPPFGELYDSAGEYFPYGDGYPRPPEDWEVTTEPIKPSATGAGERGE